MAAEDAVLGGMRRGRGGIVITASWDGSQPMTETYVLLRALFSAAREDSIRNVGYGAPFYSLSACCTQERYVVTEYEGRDKTRIRAEASGERAKDGSLQTQEFSFYPASEQG